MKFRTLSALALAAMLALLALAGCSDDSDEETTTTGASGESSAWEEEWQPEVDEFVSGTTEWSAFASEPEMNEDMAQFLQENSQAAQDALDTIDGAGEAPSDELDTQLQDLVKSIENAKSAMESAESCTGACTSEREAVTNSLTEVETSFDTISETLAQAD